MRTHAEIAADCEKRFHELQEEAARRASDPLIQRACTHCRFYSLRGDDGFEWNRESTDYHTCTEPLVQGFEKYGVQIKGRHGDFPPLCGPEKALWQPRPHPPTLWERLYCFAAKVFQ